MWILSVKWKSKNNQKEFFNEGCDDNGVNEEHDECDHSNKLINRWFNESVFFFNTLLRRRFNGFLTR